MNERVFLNRRKDMTNEIPVQKTSKVIERRKLVWGAPRLCHAKKTSAKSVSQKKRKAAAVEAKEALSLSL